MKEKKDGIMNNEQTGKRDFLKVLGAGLGVAGISSLMGGQVFADIEKKGKYVFVITHGSNEPNKAIFGLYMAQIVAQKKWGNVVVWMTFDGADLASIKKAKATESSVYKGLGNALKIMDKIRWEGGSFLVCSRWADYFGITGSDKYTWAKLTDDNWLIDNIQGAFVLWI